VDFIRRHGGTRRILRRRTPQNRPWKSSSWTSRS